MNPTTTTTTTDGPAPTPAPDNIYNEFLTAAQWGLGSDGDGSGIFCADPSLPSGSGMLLAFHTRRHHHPSQDPPPLLDSPSPSVSTGPTKRELRQYSEDEWDAVALHIKRMYITERRHLHEVVQLMRRQHGFNAT